METGVCVCVRCRKKVSDRVEVGEGEGRKQMNKMHQTTNMLK